MSITAPALICMMMVIHALLSAPLAVSTVIVSGSAASMEAPLRWKRLDGSAASSIEAPLRVVHRLNRRFRHARPSIDPDHMGVLLHVFDKSEDWDSGQLWMPCTGRGRWRGHCPSTPRDRLPSSLVYRNMSLAYAGKKPYPGYTGGRVIPMPLAEGHRGGMILRPTADQLRCGYSSDGGTRTSIDGCFCGRSLERFEPTSRRLAQDSSRTVSKHCGKHRGTHCRVSITDFTNHHNDGAVKSSSQLVHEAACSRRAWRPADFAVLLSKITLIGQNVSLRGTRFIPNCIEFVVSPTRWNAPLEARVAAWHKAAPRLVDAFFYPVVSGRPCGCEPCNVSAVPVSSPAGQGIGCGECIASCSRLVVETRLKFASTYNLSKRLTPPLVELHLDRWEQPFSLKG